MSIPYESTLLHGKLVDNLQPPEQNEAQKLLEKVLDYHPDIIINAYLQGRRGTVEDTEDQALANELAESFSTGQNRIAITTQRTDPYDLKDYDFALELGTVNFHTQSGDHQRLQKAIIEKDDGMPDWQHFRMPIHLADEATSFSFIGSYGDARTSSAYIFPEQDVVMLENMLDTLKKLPDKKWIPYFKNHPDWLGRLAISEKLTINTPVVRYPTIDTGMINAYSHVIFLEATAKEKAKANKKQLADTPESVISLIERDGKIQADCGGCASPRDIATLKGDRGHGCIVIGAQCPHCNTAFAPDSFMSDDTLKDKLVEDF